LKQARRGQLEDSELVELKEAFGARDTGDRDPDRFVRFFPGDRVVARRGWVLGLIPSPAQPVQGRQPRDPWELGAHDFDHREMAASGRGPESLVREQSGRGLRAASYPRL
jgi:hypothetical protein